MPDPAKLKVFLCHASPDKPAVIRLYERLSILSWVKPWLDKKDLIPGQNWRVEIPKAIRQSEIVVACLSRNSINREGYVQKEIGDALDVAQEKPEGTIYMIPLRLEECEVPEQLSQWHWVDHFEEDGFEHLLRALRMRAEKLGIVIPETPIAALPIEKPPAPPVSAPFNETSSNAITDLEILQKLLVETKRRLTVLELQYAQFGSLNAPPHLIIQLEDARKEITILEKRVLAAQVASPISPVATPPAEKPPVATPKPAPVAPPIVKAAAPQPTPVSSVPESEQTRLLREIGEFKTTHQRRMEIGDRLSEMGDPRKGVGVRPDGLPDIAWLAVAPGGKLKIDIQTFEVQPFYIAQYQITFAQYEAFVQAKDGYQNPEWWQDFPKEYQLQKLHEQRQKCASNPRDSISWYQAMAFGRWLNKRMQGWQLPSPSGSGSPLIIGENAQVRLPHEWEWQWAAQGGSQQRKYPWGAWQKGYANTDEAGLGRTTAVGMYPQGAAVCGALDMNGNLWEWCQYRGLSLGASLDSQVLRGGSYYHYHDLAFCSYGTYNDPYRDLDYYGFRVVVCSANAPQSAPTPVAKAAAPKPAPTKTEAERLLDEIAAPNTTHQRRMEIGNRLSEIGDTRQGVGVRKDGIPDIEWRAVAPGGNLDIENYPRRKQTFKVQPFYIAQYQITFAQYQAFVQAKDGYNNREWWQGFPKEYQPQTLKGQKQMRLNNPRDNISWYQSVAFGRWLNRRMQGWQLPSPGGGNNPLVVGQNAQVRLPTEWEWQWAAQAGNQKRAYPWGEWKEGYANTYEAGLARTTAVGMYPQGAAACGAMDMSGNVEEWCQNKYELPENVAVDGMQRAVRGGSFYNNQTFSCAYRSLSLPSHVGNLIGFRLVVSSPIAGL